MITLSLIRADEGSKCSSYLYESISDPEFALSGEPGHCSLAKAFNYDKALWDFYEEPSQKHRLYRFGVAMEGVKRFEPPDLAVDGDGPRLGRRGRRRRGGGDEARPRRVARQVVGGEVGLRGPAAAHGDHIVGAPGVKEEQDLTVALLCSHR